MKTNFAHSVLRHIAMRLRAWWQHIRLDERTRWLSRAVDHADLERRQRSLERCGRC